MGFGTTLYTDIYFNRETFNSRHQVESALEDAKDRIEWAKKELTKLAFMTEPKKFCGEDESPESYLKETLADAVEELMDAATEEYKLVKLLDDWNETHDSEGKAIRPSDEDRKPFICGDFIE